MAIYYEDVREGEEVPSLAQRCDSQRLVYWAGASGDFDPVHYDKDFAHQSGLPERIVQGDLKLALIARMLHNWAGQADAVKHIACRYRKHDQVDGEITCKGVVLGKRVEDGKRIVELEVWTEDSKGQGTTMGWAAVSLPSRTTKGSIGKDQ